MNKNFSEWYRIAKIEPTSEQLNNRWNGIIHFTDEQLQIDDIFELVRMFYGRTTQENFRDRYAECFVKFDSAFDRNNELELSVLAGTTLIEIIENYDYSILAMLATISFSFLKVSPVVPSILIKIKQKFVKETSSTREDILNEDVVSYSHQKSNELLEILQESQANWTADIQLSLIEYITENNKKLDSLYKKEKQNRQIISIYSEDSQILWWMTGEWSNDLDKSFHEIRQVDATLYIGKELADKIKNLPGPYSAKAVIHKMLDCCNKRNRCQTINLKDVVESLEVTWKEEFLKKYAINGIKEITPIMLAISKSITVDKGVDWNPQFEKIALCSSEDIIKPAEEMAFQMYLECLTIKCYTNIEE